MNARWIKAVHILSVCIMILPALFATEASAKLNIVASFQHDASIAAEIGGDRVEVTSLTTGTQDPHAVEPKPILAVLLGQADLLIVNGQHIEIHWLPIALATSRNLRIQEGKEGYLNAATGVTLIHYAKEELRGTPFAFTLDTGAHEKTGNHHYWLEPANGLIIARNIHEKLAQMDPTNAAYYKSNYETFTTRLRDKIKDWDAMMAPYKGMKVVSYHRDWIYLTRRHGLEVAAYIEPRETIPPSASDIAILVKRIKEERIPLILISPWQPQRISREIAKQTGTAFLSLPSTVDARLGVKDYINLFDVVYAQLTKALQEAKR